ncbi:unnamed protein product [Mortierella alpina]
MALHEVHAEKIESNWEAAVHDFENMMLSEGLPPTNIQRHAIPAIIAGRYVDVQSPSGTGKTTSFLIAALQKLDALTSQSQVLILVPTVQSGAQIQRVILALGGFMKIRCACLGGTNVRDEVRALEAGAHVVIGTPPLVLNMIDRQSFDASSVKMALFDDADKQMALNFRDTIFDIMLHAPPQCQVVFTSGTTSEDVEQAAIQFMEGAIQIVGRE